MKKCFKCRSPISLEAVLFRDECPVCGSDLHVCVNCTFYDPGKHNSCREPQAEYVRERDRANYCDYFVFGDAERKRSGREEAENLWEKLFKK
jgi:hypothetical protein